MKKVLLIIFIPLVVLATPLLFSQNQEDGRYLELQNFAKVLNILEKNYVEVIPLNKLVTGAIKGMLRELDPHSSYMSPEAFKEFETETSGEFGGIGIEITIDNNQLTIISPIEDTPAWQAGLQSKDKIIAINGASTKGLSLIEASKMLKGRRGDKVTLSISRENSKPFDVLITRASIKVKAVKSVTIENKFLYTKITSFIENTSSQLEKSIKEHIEKNKNLAGLIIDLRRNPGGLLNQAIQVSDLFLKEGLPIVSTRGRSEDTKDAANSTNRIKYLDFPILVLIDEGSASASEIVAGALQDHKRALIVGTKSFGKGSVQSIMKLGDGGALKITVARYFTPSGRSIQAEGITPDLSLENLALEIKSEKETKSKKLRERDMTNHLTGDNELKQQKPLTQAEKLQEEALKDPVLIHSLNYLKAMTYSTKSVN